MNAPSVPCHLHVGSRAIDEAEIAREMQHHRSASPQRARAEAARALAVRELLRLEIGRLGIAAAAAPIGAETAEEAQIRCLLEQAIAPRVPSDAECRRYFEQNRERFCTPLRIRARHVLLAAAPGDPAAREMARTRAEQLIAQLAQRPALFADFALRFSACPSRDAGGDLGWLQRGSLTPELERQIFGLPVGMAPLPAESRFGYHIVRIEDREEGRPLPYEAVRQELADYLELRVHRLELQRYLVGLQERFGVRGLSEIEAQALPEPPGTSGAGA